jgi:hypothetical protein
MRRRVVRLAVLISLGLFAACATSSDPEGTAPPSTTVPAKDASADRNTGKDTGSFSDIDSGEEQEDAAADEDAGDDAGEEADADETGTDAGTDSDTDAAETGTDASGVDAADASDASDANDANDATSAVDAGCNDLVYGAPELTINQSASNPPASTGGTVVDGTYNLSAYTVYTGPGGASGPGGLTLQSIVRIQGNAIERLVLDYSGIERRQSGTFVAGTPLADDITITWTCGSGAPEVGKYSASSSKFAFYPLPGYEVVHSK